MDLEQIKSLTDADMEAVNAYIRKHLSSPVALIESMAEYIIASGGKRLRPMLAVLAARACGYQGEKHAHVAAVVEFIHTATLLHDDVVDASELRRGRDTANTIWGNEATVLVGDFIFSRSFEMMVEIGQMRVMEILSTTSNRIAEGEVMQLLNCNDPDTNEQRYMDVIRCKTAQLFEGAAQLGAILAGQPQEVEKACAAYGLHLGIAFQLVDDVLDYRATSDEMGKNLGDDLAEGKPTLPIIHAMQNGNEEQVKLLREVIEHGGRDQLDQVLEIIEQTNALAYTEEVAKREAQAAIEQLAHLPQNEHTQALAALAEFSVARTH